MSDNELTLVTARDERTVTRRSKQACAVAIWDALVRSTRRSARPCMTERHQPGRTNRGCTRSQRRGHLGGDRSRRRDGAAGDRQRRAGDPRPRARCSSGACWRSCARGTSSSRTSPASARRCSPSRSPARSTASSRASRRRPTCCRPTSPASASSTSRANEFEFKPGPVFANLVLVDEINRASPKTQSALLECMQEAQVTVDGVTHPLARPFMVIATQNPIEYEGTFPLPEAQLDRFTMLLTLGYPGARRGGHDALRARRRRAARGARGGHAPHPRSRRRSPPSRRSSSRSQPAPLRGRDPRAIPAATRGSRSAPARARGSRCCGSPRRYAALRGPRLRDRRRRQGRRRGRALAPRDPRRRVPHRRARRGRHRARSARPHARTV